MSKKFKEYLVSSIITFTATFCATLLLQVDGLTLEAMRNGVWVGLVFTAFRTGLKAVLQFLSTIAIK